MRQISQNYKTGELKLEEVPIPLLQSGGVLVRNRRSLVSVGTEKSMTELAQKSIIGKAKERPDLVKQVIDKAKKDGIINTINAVKRKLDVVKPLGYSSAGIVVEVGQDVDEFQPGDSVACAGAGYASHADVVFVPKNLCAMIPRNVSFEDAACATVGAVALQGVRVANPLLGEKIAVIGLGLVGQITAQLLQSSGCMVLGFDMESSRVETAVKLGLDVGVSEIKDVEKAVNAISKCYGMDAIIITASTQSSSPIELAGKIARDKGRVVVVGNVGMNVPRESFYRKELDLRLSRSYGPGRYDPVYEEKGIDYPFGYVRWTEKRNVETFLELVSRGKLEIEPLITHRFPIEKAETIYGVLNGKVSIDDPEVSKYRKSITSDDKEKVTGGGQLLGVLIEYKEGPKTERTIQIKNQISTNPQSPIPNPQSLSVGLIGAGNFVKNTLLPILKDVTQLKLRGLSTATGLNAKVNAVKHDFEYCTTDYHEILNDSEIDIVIIGTRHGLHSKIVVDALNQGKDVFVEKPLAIHEEELDKVIDAWQNSKQRLMVGFNRRFSPFTVKVKEFFAKRKEPLVLNYRINAGFIPKDSWVHDTDEGGGRIIGEVCHFVDLLQFLTGSQPVKVFAELMSNTNNYVNDNVNISLKFRDGSIGCVTYLSCGDKVFSKERLEVFGEGAVAVIDDFKSGYLVRNGKTKKIKARRNDKGHRNEIEEFVSAIREGKECPVPFDESVMATRLTFKIMESIKKGVPVLIED
ncbi:MAG: bi-domain-containing oxidoreductase [Candidatus Anammoxibacter sp.]